MSGGAGAQVDLGRRVLLRVPNWLGDLAHAWPLVAALGRVTPQLLVAARPRVAGLFELLTGEWTLLEWPARPSPRAVLACVRELRRQQPDSSVLLPLSFEAALAPWLAGVPRRVGFAAHGRAPLLTLAAPRPRGLHQRDEYLRLTDVLGLELRPEDLRPSLEPAVLERERPRWGHWLTGRKYALLAPGAAYGGAKRWGAERFGRLAALLSAHGLAVAVVGSVGERGLGSQVAAAAVRSGGPAPVELCGATSLASLAVGLAGARVVVGNDSGVLHLASLLGVPAVGIYGATDPQRTGPRGELSRLLHGRAECSPCGLRECAQSAHDCMIRVAPEQVLEAALELLAGGREGA